MLIILAAVTTNVILEPHCKIIGQKYNSVDTEVIISVWQFPGCRGRLLASWVNLLDISSIMVENGQKRYKR